MSSETEVDLKDVELNEVDQERQPMNASNGDAGSPQTEKNGIVKVKIPEEKEAKFTGLSKEELLQVAGTPGWVRTRWALLILFWLGWLGMLAGAIAIIVQAPRCKPLPEMNWWNFGALYQVGDVNSFAEAPGLEGLSSKMSDLGKMNVKGLVLGPIHVSTADKPEDLNLTEISPEVGNLTHLESVVMEAHKKSISVVLDLSPNYKGSKPWFDTGDMTKVAEKVQAATDYWLNKGIDGILLHDVEQLTTKVPLIWSSIRDSVKNNTNEEEKKRALIGVTQATSPEEVATLLNTTGVDLLLSGVLRQNSTMKTIQAVDRLYSEKGHQLAWNIGDRIKGHLATLMGYAHVKWNQLLLLTLPGVPVFNYGDEIGLEDESSEFPLMVWDTDEKAKQANESERDEIKNRDSLRSFFKLASGLRGKERSLLHGDYVPLFSSSTAFAYLRVWDQSERYLVALSSSTDPVELKLTHSELPETATVVVSTDESLATDTSVDLATLKLKPNQAVMLKFPYAGK